MRIITLVFFCLGHVGALVTRFRLRPTQHSRLVSYKGFITTTRAIDDNAGHIGGLVSKPEVRSQHTPTRQAAALSLVFMSLLTAAWYHEIIAHKLVQAGRAYIAANAKVCESL